MRQEEGLVRELLPCTCLLWLVGARDPREDRDKSLTSTGTEGRDTLRSKVNCNVLSFLHRDSAVTASVLSEGSQKGTGQGRSWQDRANPSPTSLGFKPAAGGDA